MWPIVMAALRRNVPYITLPAAAVIGKFDFFNFIFLAMTFNTMKNNFFSHTQVLLAIIWKIISLINIHLTMVKEIPFDFDKTI